MSEDTKQEVGTDFEAIKNKVKGLLEMLAEKNEKTVEFSSEISKLQEVVESQSKELESLRKSVEEREALLSDSKKTITNMRIDTVKAKIGLAVAGLAISPRAYTSVLMEDRVRVADDGTIELIGSDGKAADGTIEEFAKKALDEYPDLKKPSGKPGGGKIGVSASEDKKKTGDLETREGRINKLRGFVTSDG